MDDSEQSRTVPVSRRSVLGAVGTTFVGGVVASADPLDEDVQSTVRQGDRCVPVTPLSGSGPVEEFYDYRIPRQYASAENGGSDPGTGPYFSSTGTQDLQRQDTSIAFLYDGPQGLSLVVVHGKVGTSPNGGGAATFEIAGLPSNGEWVVEDDLYRDSQTEDPAATNYDNWDVDGATHRIDWTWSAHGTDGGAFRGLDGGAAVTVSPSFNGDSHFGQQHYEGTVDAWEFLSADGDGVQRHSLDMATPLTIHPGPCEGESTQPSETDGPGDGVSAVVHDVEFEGCGDAWVVFEEAPDGTVDATVETSKGTSTVEVAPDDLTTVPGQYGSEPLYKILAPGKLLAVEVGGTPHENGNQCAQNARGGGNDHPDEEDDGDAGNHGKGNGKDEGEREEAKGAKKTRRKTTSRGRSVGDRGVAVGRAEASVRARSRACAQPRLGPGNIRHGRA